MAPDATPDPRLCKTLSVIGLAGGGEGKRAARKRRGGAGTKNKTTQGPRTKHNLRKLHRKKQRCATIPPHRPADMVRYILVFSCFWFARFLGVPPPTKKAQRSEKQKTKNNTRPRTPHKHRQLSMRLGKFCGGGTTYRNIITSICGRTHTLGKVPPAPATHVCPFSLLHRGLIRALLLQATRAQVLPLFSLSLNPGPFFGPRPRPAERSTTRWALEGLGFRAGADMASGEPGGG